MTGPLSVLSGALLRQGPNDWRWSDGIPEPRVRDLSPDDWNFRCRTIYSGGEPVTFAEVLRGVAMETPALRWVLQGAREGRYQGGQSGDHTGAMVIREDGTSGRAHIRPGEDPLLGAEPLPERLGPIPAVILVPVEDWDRWVREHPAGAMWEKADEPAILARARELGWREGEESSAPSPGEGA